MEDWIQEELSKYDLKTVEIDFSVHVLKGKNLKPDDLDKPEETIRKGRVVEEKSDRLRKTIGFRLYFGKENLTYTVIVGLHGDLLRIVTLWRDGGRL